MTVPSENELEVLGFLRLVAAYNLASTYDTEELRRLLSSISYRQQAAQLHQALGIADKAPGMLFLFYVFLFLFFLFISMSEYGFDGLDLVYIKDKTPVMPLVFYLFLL